MSSKIKTPEAIASAVKEFTETDFGKHFIEDLAERRKAYERISRSLTASLAAHVKAAANERAAAIEEIEEFFSSNVYLSEHPEAFDQAKSDETIDSEQ